jgi:hypothetical protein
MFVDWIFTSFVERPFTNVFNATPRLNAAACLYRACNAD